jgi:5-methylcytosine-specific restriction endonuclease McrA
VSASERRQAYLDYLASDAWKAIRRRVLARDKWTCQDCNARAGDVHHETYDRFGHEELDDLASLCRSCHDVRHGRKKSPDPHQKGFRV